MTETELWTAYLDLISMMTEMPASYGLDDWRERIHTKLSQLYQQRHNNWDKEKFNIVCHNLDKILRVTFPIDKREIKLSVKDIRRRFAYQDLRDYCTNRISKLRGIKL